MRYNRAMIEVIHYQTDAGEDVFAAWIASLRDQQAAARIASRVERICAGLVGDCKPLAEGVWELRVDWGPGYRVYYAQSGRQVILLLCGGDKRRQKADIKRAIALWQDWQRRMK